MRSDFRGYDDDIGVSVRGECKMRGVKTEKREKDTIVKEASTRLCHVLIVFLCKSPHMHAYIYKTSILSL